MIQRFIFSALKNGIEQITEDVTLLELLFEELFLLEPTEVAKIKTLWAAKPPKVTHGYAPKDTEPPLYSVTMQSESESNTFLNNDGKMVTDPEDPDFGADVKASIWTHVFQIHCFTEHPDVTTYYYEVAKSILLANTDFFSGREMFNIRID